MYIKIAQHYPVCFVILQTEKRSDSIDCMPRLLVLTYLTLFLYCTGIAQTATTKNGLTTIVFDTKYAIVTMYLPDDLQSGDKISGTFSIFVAGLSDEQLAFSLAEVRKYKFNFSNPVNHTNVMQKMINIQPDQLVNMFPVNILSSLIISLTESTGKTYTHEIKTITDPLVPVDDCLSPEHVLLGKPLRIIGTFDGSAANTRVSIGSTIFKVLAESPRQCIVDVPFNLTITDNMEIKVMEDFKPKCVQPVTPVKMIVGAEKSFVKKGESTTMYFTVRGLQDMDKPSYLNVVNATPDVVTVKNGNKQKIEINAAQFNGGNEYKMNFSLQAISTGEFSLDFSLDIPEDFPPMIER